MKQAVMAVVVVAWVLAGAGCATSSSPAPPAVQFGELAGFGPVAPLLAASDTEGLPGGLEAEQKLPRGPADPLYQPPVMNSAGVNDRLAVTSDGSFRHRNWEPGVARYSDGRVTHMPRWYADPYDDVTQPRADGFGPGGDDLLASVYNPGRFLVNLVASPVSAVVHPIWAPATTDGGAAIVDGPKGVEIRK